MKGNATIIELPDIKGRIVLRSAEIPTALGDPTPYWPGYEIPEEDIEELTHYLGIDIHARYMTTAKGDRIEDLPAPHFFPLITEWEADEIWAQEVDGGLFISCKDTGDEKVWISEFSYRGTYLVLWKEGERVDP